MKSIDTSTPSKTSSSLLGSLLLMAGTTLVTILAMKNSEKIVAGVKSVAQHMADGSLAFPAATSLNGGTRHTMTPAN